MLALDFTVPVDTNIMIVCLCNAVSDKDIRQAVREGVASLQQLTDTLKVGQCCGLCCEHAAKCIADCRAEEPCPAIPW